MTYYAGLDISMKETSIAIANEKGKIIFERVCETEPEIIAKTLKEFTFKIEKIGLESGCLSFWLIEALKEFEVSSICIESKQMARIISLKVNKTDKNDARAIADAMRCNLYKEVYHKSKEAIDIGLQMGTRRTLVNIRTQLKNSIRGYLKAYGIRLGTISHEKFPEKVRQSLNTHDLYIQGSIEGLVKSYEEVCKNINETEEILEKICKKDPVIEIFESIPGIGTITAMTYKAVIDNPYRFKNSRDVGAYLGLTPKQYSSGEMVRQGRISKCGCSELRMLLIECATVILTRTTVWTKLKAWGLKILKRSGIKKAAAAVARKLAIIMLRMWQEGKAYVWGEQKDKADVMIAM